MDFLHRAHMTSEQIASLSLEKEGALRFLRHSSPTAGTPSVIAQYKEVWNSNHLLSVSTQVDKVEPL